MAEENKETKTREEIIQEGLQKIKELDEKGLLRKYCVLLAMYYDYILMTKYNREVNPMPLRHCEDEEEARSIVKLLEIKGETFHFEKNYLEVFKLKEKKEITMDDLYYVADRILSRKINGYYHEYAIKGWLIYDMLLNLLYEDYLGILFFGLPGAGKSVSALYLLDLFTFASTQFFRMKKYGYESYVLPVIYFDEVSLLYAYQKIKENWDDLKAKKKRLILMSDETAVSAGKERFMSNVNKAQRDLIKIVRPLNPVMLFVTQYISDLDKGLRQPAWWKYGLFAARRGLCFVYPGAGRILESDWYKRSLVRIIYNLRGDRGQGFEDLMNRLPSGLADIEKLYPPIGMIKTYIPSNWIWEMYKGAGGIRMRVIESVINTSIIKLQETIFGKKGRRVRF